MDGKTTLRPGYHFITALSICPTITLVHEMRSCTMFQRRPREIVLSVWIGTHHAEPEIAFDVLQMASILNRLNIPTVGWQPTRKQGEVSYERPRMDT